jgi:hypothetical protein
MSRAFLDSAQRAAKLQLEISAVSKAGREVVERRGRLVLNVLLGLAYYIGGARVNAEMYHPPMPGTGRAMQSFFSLRD